MSQDNDYDWQEEEETENSASSIDPSSAFKAYKYQDPFSVNYWKKKCKCKAEGFIWARSVQGNVIWTDETEEGPLCKQCMSPWKLVICYPAESKV